MEIMVSTSELRKVAKNLAALNLKDKLIMYVKDNKLTVNSNFNGIGFKMLLPGLGSYADDGNLILNWVDFINILKTKERELKLTSIANTVDEDTDTEEVIQVAKFNCNKLHIPAIWNKESKRTKDYSKLVALFPIKKDGLDLIWTDSFALFFYHCPAEIHYVSDKPYLIDAKLFTKIAKILDYNIQFSISDKYCYFSNDTLTIRCLKQECDYPDVYRLFSTLNWDGVKLFINVDNYLNMIKSVNLAVDPVCHMYCRGKNLYGNVANVKFPLGKASGKADFYVSLSLLHNTVKQYLKTSELTIIFKSSTEPLLLGTPDYFYLVAIRRESDF